MHMAEPMAVWAEAWPLAATSTGIKLLTTERLITGSPVPADSDPWDEAKALLRQIGVVDEPELAHECRLVYLHGSSNRPDHGRWIVTHLAVVEAGEVTKDDPRWPDAVDIRDLLEYFGRPYPHGATEPPVPRDADVVNHAAGHAADLLAKNSEFIAAIDGTPSGEDWRRELGLRAPELAMMYRTDWDTLGRTA
jgi:hypothetical protein